MNTDTTEKGLETLIMRHLTGADGLSVVPNQVAERPPPDGGIGYTAGSAQDYDRNPFLADAMVELNLIDTRGGGIKCMFETQ